MDLDASQAKNIADCNFLNEQNYGVVLFPRAIPEMTNQYPVALSISHSRYMIVLPMRNLV
jgi:hypothetical protein